MSLFLDSKGVVLNGVSNYLRKNMVGCLGFRQGLMILRFTTNIQICSVIRQNWKYSRKDLAENLAII